MNSLLSGLQWPGPVVTVTLTDLTPADQVAARAAQRLIEAACAIRFTEVESGGVISYSYAPLDGLTGYAYFPGAGDLAGDVLFAPKFRHEGYDQYRLPLHLHELGHALGLQHPADHSAQTVMGDDFNLSALQPMDVEALQAMYGAPDVANVVTGWGWIV